MPVQRQCTNCPRLQDNTNRISARLPPQCAPTITAKMARDDISGISALAVLFRLAGEEGQC